jgi:Cu(I)/Ag(I) efflux system periplasmic protein CusF
MTRTSSPDTRHRTLFTPAWRRLLLAAALSGLASGALADIVDGEVLKVDKQQRRLTLKHGPIKSIDMPAMSMSFRLANPAWVDSVKVGDKVKFEAEKVDGYYTVTKLETSP